MNKKCFSSFPERIELRHSDNYGQLSQSCSTHEKQNRGKNVQKLFEQSLLIGGLNRRWRS